MNFPSHLWVTVLAGGDGHRLSSVTRDATGRHVPKQFCAFAHDGSLLHRALVRASTIVGPDHIITVVQEAHRRWWEHELLGWTGSSVVVQPSNLGTAVAVLHAIVRALEHDRDPYLLVVPSDYEVDDERAWRDTLVLAVSAARGSPEQLVVVGMEPQSDPGFGWMIPGNRAPDGTSSVLAFVEKPAPEEAAYLVGHGALCSTFVFASSASALLHLFIRQAPELVSCALEALRKSGDSGWSLQMAAGLPGRDFSRDLLERSPQDVRVLPAPRCGWTDLGTPARLERWLERSARRTAGRERPSHQLMALGS